MATNVNPDELNYDHYETEKYDDDIVRSIPGHEEMHQHIEQIIKKNYSSRRKVRVLELGIGTGLTAVRILKILPGAEYTAVDFSNQMLAGARQHLSQYNVTFVNGDYSQINLPENNDLVVSVIGIHHQETDDDKKRLFQRIYNSLNDTGAFIFGDLVTHRNPEEAALNEAKHFHHLVKNVKDKESLREWEYHHKFLNRLAPIEDQVEWLRKAGFREIKRVYQECNTALIYARK